MPAPSERYPVAYVIADYRTPELALEALRSIRRHRAHAPVAVVDAATGGLGYSSALNLGFEAVERHRPEVVAFLNADVEMLEDDEPLLELFDDRDVAIVGPRQVTGEGRLAHAGIVPHEDGTQWDVDLRHRCWLWHLRDGQVSPDGANWRDDDLTGGTFEVPMVPGSVAYARADAMRELGGWPTWTTFYYEDAGLCYLARWRGRRVLYTGKVTWLHHGEASPLTMADRRRRMATARARFLEFGRRVGIPLRDSPSGGQVSLDWPEDS